VKRSLRGTESQGAIKADLNCRQLILEPVQRTFLKTEKLMAKWFE
jgi:hypothetical protein